MATLAYDAGATKLADLLGVDLRETKKSKDRPAPRTSPCRCVDARGRRDPCVWASDPGMCRCGRWLPQAIGDLRAHSDREALAELDAAIEHVRAGLLEEATLDGVMDEDDYEHWLETRLAALTRDLERATGRRVAA